jgi:3-keto-disaccharide hydrolase
MPRLCPSSLQGLLCRRTIISSAAVVTVLLLCSLLYAQRLKEYLSGIKWPEVKVVDPGAPGEHPGDAIVLFDGKDMSQWVDGNDWIVKDGYVITTKHDIHTKQAFGDCQLHVEWAAPEQVSGSGQGRGNSGVFLMSLYELQVLDSYDNTTYPDGQAGAIYKQQPPLVNVCRKPGEWQTYDVVFSAPKFDEQGKLAKPAYITVLQNGVLVQNHFEIQGSTSFTEAPKYTAHAAKMPLQLQYHNNKVRFRNIWIREI